MKTKHLLSLILWAGATPLLSKAETIDWNAIRYWCGEGENKAALVVQFNTGQEANPGALVWGYRWSDEENPSGEDMVRKIAAASADLTLFTQFTGNMGNTVCGFGYARERATLLSALKYDYEGALSDENISFGFLEPNEDMGQTHAPGQDALDLAMMAIMEAKESHIIDHPMGQDNFGYAAYDYDWWQLDPTTDSSHNDLFWNAGWYNGYWSYWVGTADMDALGYSGLGMTSVKVSDGDVNGWRYNRIDGNSGASVQLNRKDAGSTGGWLPLNYLHFDVESSATELIVTEGKEETKYYSIDGRPLSCPPARGIYIVIQGNRRKKQIIK